ncbi:MAG: DUF11 domain-containing protein, partial [Bifidobacteriaceae bacterium]|nr:DUF11 domain-containing protein [Bifidobacteriaceae bacterium]
MASIRRVATMTAAAALALAGVLTVSTKPAEAVDPSAKFQKAFEANVNGAVIAIGNGLLTCPTTAGDPCTGQAQKGGKWDNNSFRMVYLDVDGDASTKTSSSSFLDLPDGAQVLFARLYWGARLTAGGSSPVYPGDQSLAHTMKFKLPGETAYRNVTGSLMALNSSQNGAYQASADVTAWVQALPGGPNGEYWGADVQAGTGLDRYAGWSMMVAYTAPGLPLRNLTVFEGFTTVNSLYQDSITVSGFLAPESGLVDAQLSMVAYEGDLAQTSDYTLLGTTQLATAVSPGSNFFDSVNSLNGDYVTTKNPAFQNMLGFDIKNLGVSGAIENGATDATFSFRTGGDVYYPGVVALAINLYAPDFTTSTKAGVNLTSSDGAWPGDTLQYTMTYNNTGQDPATNSVACDPIPAGSTYVPGSLTLVSAPSDYGLATPLALPDDGSSLGKYDISDPSKPQVCVNLGFGATSSAGGTIRVGDSTSYQFQVRIADTAGGSTVRNVAHLDYITATTKTPATYDTPPVATPVGLKADVSITKDMTPNPAIAGQAGRTTLRVTNLGPSQATGLTVTDPLPADYVATGATWSGAGGSGTCSTADGQVVCTGLPSLNLGQEIAIFINGSAKSDSLATTMSNTASVTTTSFDPVMSNNVATVSIPMTHQADLGITKTPTPQTVVPGKEIAWTLTVTNQCKPGSAPATNPEGCLSDATGVIISDTVADSSKLVLTGATGGAGTGGAEGDVKVTCPDSLTSPATFQCQVTSTDGLGRLKPKQTAVVKVTGYLMAHVATATENQAAVTSKTFDPVQSDNLTSATVTPGAAQSTIKLTKTGPASAVAGTRIDYTITAQNQGPSDAAGVVVTDTLPAQLSADSGTLVTSDRGSCAITTGAAPTVTCAVGALPGPGAPGGAGGIATIKITGVLLSASAAQGSTVTNSATVTCSSDCAQDPSDPPGVTTTVDTAADLAVAKTTTQPKLPAANSQVTYEITVTNNGPSDAVNVTLEDVLPEGMSLVSLTQYRSGSCLNASATCELASLPVGGVWNITVVGKVGATAYAPDATPTQTATVSSDTYDPDETDNQAKWVHRGEPQADLALTKSSSGFTAGEAGTYILKVTNNGPDAAADVTVVDTIPVGLTPDQSATNWPGVCQAQAEQQTQSWSVTCALTDLANGYSATVYIPVTADASLNNGAVLVNVAVAASTTADPTTSNNAAFTVDTVKALADVQVDFEIL